MRRRFSSCLCSPSLSRCLTTQDIYSLTVSSILTTIPIVEVEYITELCRHEQRHFHNVLVIFTMGIKWCVQLLFALVYSTGSGVGHRATQTTSRLPSPTSPPTNWRRKQWGGKRMFAGGLLGRFRALQTSRSPAHSLQQKSQLAMARSYTPPSAQYYACLTKHFACTPEPFPYPFNYSRR